MVALLLAFLAGGVLWLVQPAHAGTERRTFGASDQPLRSDLRGATTPIGATIASFGSTTNVPADLWEDRAKGSAGMVEEPLAAIQRAMEPAGGFRPSADVERWLRTLRVGKTDSVAAASFSAPNRVQHLWGEWDAGGHRLRGSYATSRTERRISISMLASEWQALEFSNMRGRAADTPWSDTANASFRYTVSEAAYTYRQHGWNVRAAAGVTSARTGTMSLNGDAGTGGGVDAVQRWTQSFATSYRLTPQLLMDSKIEMAPGQVDKPSLAMSAEYQPATQPDVSMTLGYTYGYSRYGFMEPNATSARGALLWRPPEWGVKSPTVTFETGYRRAGDGPRSDTRNEDLAALVTVRLSDATWRDVVTAVEGALLLN
ncbi:MAG TPA: hypothetical protein VFA38_02380 [Nitrospirales bacterium]|nr:hypothetical protein [Nitrospirales bacterium]